MRSEVAIQKKLRFILVFVLVLISLPSIEARANWEINLPPEKTNPTMAADQVYLDKDDPGEPKSIQEAISRVKSITASNPGDQTRLRAKEAARIVRKRVMVINNISGTFFQSLPIDVWNQLKSGLPFKLSASLKERGDALSICRGEKHGKFGRSVFKSGFDSASCAWVLRAGQCDEHADLVSRILVGAGETNVQIFRSSSPHAFCVVGLNSTADPDVPWTWGSSWAVFDSWNGKSFDKPLDIWVDGMYFSGGSQIVSGKSRPSTTREFLSKLTKRGRDKVLSSSNLVSAFKERLESYCKIPYKARPRSGPYIVEETLVNKWGLGLNGYWELHGGDAAPESWKVIRINQLKSTQVVASLKDPNSKNISPFFSGFHNPDSFQVSVNINGKKENGRVTVLGTDEVKLDWGGSSFTWCRREPICGCSGKSSAKTKQPEADWVLAKSEVIYEGTGKKSSKTIVGSLEDLKSVTQQQGKVIRPVAGIEIGRDYLRIIGTEGQEVGRSAIVRWSSIPPYLNENQRVTLKLRVVAEQLGTPPFSANWGDLPCNQYFDNRITGGTNHSSNFGMPQQKNVKQGARSDTLSFIAKPSEVKNLSRGVSISLFTNFYPQFESRMIQIKWTFAPGSQLSKSPSKLMTLNTQTKNSALQASTIKLSEQLKFTPNSDTERPNEFNSVKDPVLLNNQAVMALGRNEFDKAIKILFASLKTFPGNALSLQNLAVAFNNKGLATVSDSKACSFLRMSLYCDPSNKFSRINLDKRIVGLGINPTAAEDRLKIAREFRNSGRFMEAIVEYEIANSLRPSSTIQEELNAIRPLVKQSRLSPDD